MGDVDEELPKRPQGRPLRRMEAGALDHNPLARKSCGDCPKYIMRTMWCPLKAVPTAPQAPACRYGTVLMNAARVAEKRREDVR